MVLKNNKIKLFLLIVILFQIFLISHRISFEYKILFNFYKKNLAIEESIKSRSAIEIGNYIKKNNLDFYFEQSFFKAITDDYQNDNKDKKFYQRFIEYVYPNKLDKDSKVVISNLEKIEKCNLLFNYGNKFINECN